MQTFKNTLLLLIIFSVSLNSSWANSLNELFKSAKAQGFMGVVSLSHDKKREIASINSDNHNENTPFAVGSVSKLFTQLAILQLQEQGVLDINDGLDKHLNLADFPRDWQRWLPKITVKELIEHRSGLPNMLYWSEGTQAIFNHAKEPKSLMEFFHDGENAHINEELLVHNLNQADEEGSYYSNLGYNLLALIIENASGMSYENYLRLNVFSPLGMNDSFSGSQEDNSMSELLNRHPEMARPMAYAIDFNALKAQTNTYEVRPKPRNRHHEKEYNFVFSYGAGSVISTVTDLNKAFDAAFNTNSLLHTQKAKDYFLQTNREDNFWGHQGELPGYQAMVLYDLKQKRLVVILSNLNYDMYALHHELLELKGKNIKQYEARGGEKGLADEFSNALESIPYVMPVNIAIDALT